MICRRSPKKQTKVKTATAEAMKLKASEDDTGTNSRYDFDVLFTMEDVVNHLVEDNFLGRKRNKDTKGQNRMFQLGNHLNVGCKCLKVTHTVRLHGHL